MKVSKRLIKVLVPVVIISLVVTVTSCMSCLNGMRDKTVYDIESYRGDGKMSDHGVKAAMERFNLGFGKVDFTQEQTLIFKMTNLPAVRFCVGFDLKDMPPLLANDVEAKKHNQADINILLATAEGDKVFERTAPLADWTWSGNMQGTRRFVYLRGPIGKQEGGSSFTADPLKQYVLTVEIKPISESKAAKPAELRMSGGGWKVH